MKDSKKGTWIHWIQEDWCSFKLLDTHRSHPLINWTYQGAKTVLTFVSIMKVQLNKTELVNTIHLPPGHTVIVRDSKGESKLIHTEESIRVGRAIQQLNVYKQFGSKHKFAFCTVNQCPCNERSFMVQLNIVYGETVVDWFFLHVYFPIPFIKLSDSVQLAMRSWQSLCRKEELRGNNCSQQCPVQ